MITIDLSNTYHLTSSVVNKQISTGAFYAPQANGENILIRVAIKPHPDPLLPNVHNLSMGPPVDADSVNDTIRLRHCDSGRVFSTAILFALTFLTYHPDKCVGLDGSDDLRAILYHSMFIVNRPAMDKFFNSIGVEWYVKLLRNRSDVERTPEGMAFFKPIPEPFDYQRNRKHLYRYYIFSLKR